MGDSPPSYYFDISKFVMHWFKRPDESWSVRVSTSTGHKITDTGHKITDTPETNPYEALRYIAEHVMEIFPED